MCLSLYFFFHIFSLLSLFFIYLFLLCQLFSSFLFCIFQQQRLLSGGTCHTSILRLNTTLTRENCFKHVLYKRPFPFIVYNTDRYIILRNLILFLIQIKTSIDCKGQQNQLANYENIQLLICLKWLNII